MLWKDSKYPIIALSMNQVSNAKFAVDCYNTGIYPSISLFNYKTIKDFLLDVSYFKEKTGTTNFLFSLNFSDFENKQIRNIIDKLDIKNIELISNFYNANKSFINIKDELKNRNSIRFFLKTIDRKDFYFGKYFNGLILKGNESAGALGKNKIESIFLYTKNKYPNKFIIPSGGIQNKDQIKYFMSNGATAIGIGTLFALSEESPIPKEAKLAMINKKRNIMITQHNKLNYEKGAVIFSKTKYTDNDPNDTNSLILGINSLGEQGHLYAGSAIENIKEIKPLKQIMQELI